MLISRLLLIVCTILAANSWAQDAPLLMEGKKTLYQRVLGIPETKLYSQADEQSVSEDVVPFSVFYVYQREDDWLKVGHDSFGNISGWIPRKQTIVWNQALTVSFRDPQDTQRVMMFGDRDSLQKMVSDNDQEAYNRLYQAVIQGEEVEENPVIAIQPEAHIDIRNNFYLVPIKHHEDVYLGSEQARLLQIASVPLEDSRQQAEIKKSESSSQGDPRSQQASQQIQQPRYRSGIHFVIDSTVSMGPYIDRTREAVRKVYSAIAKQGLNDQVNFGLTAYRDNLQQVPELDYLTRTYVNLKQGADEETFFSRVNTLEPSSISSKDYREDAYAGIKAAIENSDWSEFDARYVVLITDAGPRESHDSLGATRLSASALRQLAYDKSISIWVLHLQFDSPAADHARAEEIYKQLSFYPGIGDFYYGVELGKVDEFGNVLEVLANQITQQVLATVNGVPPIPIPEQKKHLVEQDQPTQQQQPEQQLATQQQQPEQEQTTLQPEETIPSTQLAELQSRVAKLGYALRMRYLHKKVGQPLPKVFDAWMVDRDFNNPEKSTVDVRVLLTRDQLSDLKSVMQQVLELAEEGVLTPSGFINDLKSLAATISRDPSSVAGNVSAIDGNLADLGYMREYIDDLPYTGEVMNLSLASWQEWSAKEQIEFMHSLESKIHYYQALHDHTDLWVTPGGGTVNGNSVFPVVLNLLP